MRALLLALAALAALALWGATLWWGFPWVVTVSLSRPVAASGVAPVPAHPGQVVQAVMRRSVPGLDGVALGDRVQFDRYGVLAPVAGRVLCVWKPPGSLPVTLTPLGGAVRDADAVVHLTESSAAECPVAAR